jgi:hypothetical protein
MSLIENVADEGLDLGPAAQLWLERAERLLERISRPESAARRQHAINNKRPSRNRLRTRMPERPPTRPRRQIEHEAAKTAELY